MYQNSRYKLEQNLKKIFIKTSDKYWPLENNKHKSLNMHIKRWKLTDQFKRFFDRNVNTN